MRKLLAAIIIAVSILTAHNALVMPTASAVTVNPNLISAIEAAFPEEHQGMAMYVAMRESGGDCSQRIIDTNGQESAGCWQVQSVWWGDVEDDVYAQARQAARIVAEHGWSPWTTAP